MVCAVVEQLGALGVLDVSKVSYQDHIGSIADELIGGGRESTSQHGMTAVVVPGHDGQPGARFWVSQKNPEAGDED